MRGFFCKTGALFILAAALGCASAPVHPADQNAAVAEVNGKRISRATLDRTIPRLQKYLSAGGDTAATQKELCQRAMNQLILEELAVQEAGRQGIRVRAGEIQAAITTLVGHDQNDYEALLQKEGVSDSEFRENIRRAMLVRLIFTKEVFEKISVSDEDIRKEFEQKKATLIKPETLTVADASFPLQPDERTAAKNAEQLLASLKGEKDKSLADMPGKDSEYTISKLELQQSGNKTLYEAARKLKQGELSGIIKTGEAIHILQLIASAPERPLAYEEAAPGLKRQLQAEAVNKRRLEWEQELRASAKIEILETCTDRKGGR